MASLADRERNCKVPGDSRRRDQGGCNQKRSASRRAKRPRVRGFGGVPRAGGNKKGKKTCHEPRSSQRKGPKPIITATSNPERWKIRGGESRANCLQERRETAHHSSGRRPLSRPITRYKDKKGTFESRADGQRPEKMVIRATKNRTKTLH